MYVLPTFTTKTQEVVIIKIPPKRKYGPNLTQKQHFTLGKEAR